MRTCFLLLIPALLAAAELKIDHVTVAGASLENLRAALASLGLPSEDGGPHANRATRMALVSFQDGSYLELIAPQSSADPAALAHHAWAGFIQADAGPCAWAVRVPDLAAEIARLKSAGIEVGAPQKGERQRPDGVRLAWETVAVGPGFGSFFPFLIRDETPRRARAWPMGKPSAKNIAGVSKVVIAVSDLAAATKRYRQAYGVPPPIKQVDAQFGAQLALVGGTPVIFAAPLTSQGWLAERLERYGEAPCAFVFATRKSVPAPVRAQSRWFGKDISWLDTGSLGWHLGFEQAN